MLVPVVVYHLYNLILGQESVLLSLLKVREEPVHECIIVLVEYSHLIFGILMVWHLQDTLFVDHSLEDYCPFGVYIGGFLGLMGAFQVPHEGLLVPKLQKLGPAVVLHGL